MSPIKNDLFLFLCDEQSPLYENGMVQKGRKQDGNSRWGEIVCADPNLPSTFPKGKDIKSCNKKKKTKTIY